MSNKTVVFDFDGVIHSYKSGWQGATVIADPPVPGIDRALKDIHDAGYETVILSTRCYWADGAYAINQWLKEYGLFEYVDKVTKEKVPAVCYVDDRAVCFDGHPESLLDKIANFEPWWYKECSTDESGLFEHPTVCFLAKKNGESQDIFVMEEMAELQKELTKHHRGKSNRDAIVEESVDVLLTVYTLLKVYDATESEIAAIAKEKLSRVRDPLVENDKDDEGG